MGGAEKKLARAAFFIAGLEGEVVVVAADSSVPPPSSVSAVDAPCVTSLSSSVSSSSVESPVSYSESGIR